MSSSDSKASSQITTSGLINKFNNILSQSSEYQIYDSHDYLEENNVSEKVRYEIMKLFCERLYAILNWIII